jgi:hypothetical protein
MRFHNAAAGALAAAACVLSVAACASGQHAQGLPSVRATSSETAAAATNSSAITAGKTEGGISACTTSQLRITLTYTGALGGQAGGYLKFTNDSHATCSLTGWPVVAGVTANGHATTLRHARSTMYGAWRYSAPLPVLTLRPADSAYAVVAADDQPAGSQTRCPAPDVRLRVAAPGNSGTVLISGWLPGADSYLPTCTSINGSPTGETSAITTLSKLPH